MASRLIFLTEQCILLTKKMASDKKPLGVVFFGLSDSVDSDREGSPSSPPSHGPHLHSPLPGPPSPLRSPQVARSLSMGARAESPSGIPRDPSYVPKLLKTMPAPRDSQVYLNRLAGRTTSTSSGGSGEMGRDSSRDRHISGSSLDIGIGRGRTASTSSSEHGPMSPVSPMSPTHKTLTHVQRELQRSASMELPEIEAQILVLYSGGTIGMKTKEDGGRCCSITQHSLLFIFYIKA